MFRNLALIILGALFATSASATALTSRECIDPGMPCNSTSNVPCCGTPKCLEVVQEDDAKASFCLLDLGL